MSRSIFIRGTGFLQLPLLCPSNENPTAKFTMMGKTMKKYDKPVTLAIADGFTDDDLYQSGYTRVLQESAYPIVEQNRRLLTRIQLRGFRPAVELDFTANGAGVLLRHFFEAAAEYDEGRVPWRVLKELFITTDELIAALKRRADAPVCELDAAGLAFREAAILWKYNHPQPKMPRTVYLEKHFAAEAKIRRRLEELHAAYVRNSAAKGQKGKTLSAADVTGFDAAETENHRRIFQEIDRLTGLGCSIAKAIKTMLNGTYAARMRGVKIETWRRYYSEHCRRKRLRCAKADEGLNEDCEIVKVENETVKSPFETVNETVNDGFETVKVPRETVKVENETVNEIVKSQNETVKVSSETVKNLIERYPGITGKSLVEFVGKSRATVMRFIAALKAKGHIEYRGSAKTGGYFIPEKIAHKQSENGILSTVNKSTRNVLALMFAIYGGTCAYAASDGAARSCPTSPPSGQTSCVNAVCAPHSAAINPARNELKGRVVKVSDGDTITLLDAWNNQHKIRLNGIDAPEKSQAFGEKCRSHYVALASRFEDGLEYYDCW